MFLQIHTLTPYPAALLNRDDAGLAKRMPFGNATRLRVSSQCLKRHWRDVLTERLDLPDGLRTRHIFTREVLPALQRAGVGEAQARELTAVLVKALITSAGDKVDKKDDPLAMKQPALFGRPEIDYLVSLARAAYTEHAGAAAKALEEQLKSKDLRANFRAMLKAAGYGDVPAGLSAALFGRFVTSDILARVDAAVHVAHALTVHAADTEVDYFTVVDDLNLTEETGAAHAGEAELASGLYYGYVVVDVPLLVSNLSGCANTDWRAQPAAMIRPVLERLVDAIASVTPGAKLGSTAPYSRAECVLLELGARQPRTLANAFQQALKLRDDPTATAIARMGEHLQLLDGMYGALADARVVASICPTDALGPIERLPLSTAIRQVLDALFTGAAA